MTEPPRKVLIVDDEPNIVTALEFLLRRAGYDVRTATDGDQALALVEPYHPHVLLIDIMMPGKSGYEVCQRVRANPGLSDIRIVMISAKGREAEVSKGLSLGADLYVTKPFSTQALIDSINGLFQAPPAPGTG